MINNHLIEYFTPSSKFKTMKNTIIIFLVISNFTFLFVNILMKNEHQNTEYQHLICRQEVERYGGFNKDVEVNPSGYDTENGETIWAIYPDFDSTKIWCYIGQ